MQLNVGNFVMPQSREECLARGELGYQEFLNDLKNWSKIPLLNYTPLHKLKDSSLVRFRGMIQDMANPEIYLECYEIKSADGTTRKEEGKYRDGLKLKIGEEVNLNGLDNIEAERRTLFVISNPGINDWAKDYESKCNEANIKTIDVDPINDGHGGKKRAGSEGAQGMDNDAVVANNSSNAQADENKRVRTDSASGNTSTAMNDNVLGTNYLLHSPIPDRPSKACMIKIYNDFDNYKLNTLIDVIGFLSIDPSLDASTIDVDMHQDLVNAAELQAQNPPPSLVPRLHAIAVQQLSHANPLLDESLYKFTEKDTPFDSAVMCALYKDLRMVLTICLFNDDLAADYLLAQLISTIYMRTNIECAGKFTLNICNLPKQHVSEFTKQLYEIISLLLPASHYIAMTLDALNNNSFGPRKDYETNKLVAGQLQLAPHTHLVLDETQMQQGTLESSGIMNLKEIETLINRQKLMCNFQFYEIGYDANTPVLILSEGRSILASDFLVPLNPDPEYIEHYQETLKAGYHCLQQPRLNQFRRYLTHARTCTFTMNSEDTEMIQVDFVKMRKTDSSMSIDDLHCLLVLSRVSAISRGKIVFDKEAWALAKDMERERKKRLLKMPYSSKFRLC